MPGTPNLLRRAECWLRPPLHYSVREEGPPPRSEESARAQPPPDSPPDCAVRIGCGVALLPDRTASQQEPVGKHRHRVGAYTSVRFRSGPADGSGNIRATGKSHDPMASNRESGVSGDPRKDAEPESCCLNGGTEACAQPDQRPTAGLPPEGDTPRRDATGQPQSSGFKCSSAPGDAQHRHGPPPLLSLLHPDAREIRRDRISKEECSLELPHLAGEGLRGAEARAARHARREAIRPWVPDVHPPTAGGSPESSLRRPPKGVDGGNDPPKSRLRQAVCPAHNVFFAVPV